MKKTFVRLLFFLVIVFSLTPIQKVFSNQDKAVQSYQKFKSTVGGSGVIRQRYVNPLLSNTPMYTIDNSKSFNAQILCPSSTEFMVIVGQPTSTGDVNVTVFLDKNRDGRMDSQFYFEGISGVCANGFIRCTPGKWQECGYYKFFYDGNNLTAREASFKELGGCFCINNACGSNLFQRNARYVLDVLGGAIVQEFHRIDPSFTVSSGVFEGNTLKFYAQSISNCQVAGGSSYVRNLTQYMENTHRMQGDANLQFMSESQTPGTVAYNVVQIARKMDEIFEQKTCIKKRTFDTIDYDLSKMPAIIRKVDETGRDVVGACGGEVFPGPYVCGERCIYFRFHICQGCHTHPSHTYIEFWAPAFLRELVNSIKAHWKTDRLTPPKGGYPCFNSKGEVHFYLNGQYAGGDSYQASEGAGDCRGSAPDHWVTINKNLIVSSFSPYNTVKNVLYIKEWSYPPVYREYTVCEYLYDDGCYPCEYCYEVEIVEYYPVKDCRPMTVYFYLNKPVRGCYIASEYINDQCNILENDPDCILWEEKVDNVITVKNGVKTGLYPLTKCEVICDEVFCRSPWIVERKYMCKKRGVDLSDAKKRLESIYSSSAFDPSTGKISFTDIRKEKGVWNTYPSQNIQVNALFSRDSSECEPVCKVEVPELGKEVRMRMNLKTDPKKTYTYRPCQKENNTYICPTNQGEIIVRDCTCHSFFPEASIALQALRLASSDFICSSGINKAF